MQKEKSESLFAGGERVYFRQVGGQFTSISQISIENTPIAKSKIDELLKYKYPLIRKPVGDFKPTEDPKSGVYVPCVPHLDLTISTTPASSAGPDFKCLTEPLVKCKQEHSNFQGIAYASGKRSALLVAEDGTFIRLKGCGNLDQGFPVEPMPWPADTIEVRGCQFANTVYRELEFQNRVNHIL